MFDPTVFENLKVAIENQVYDLDNITGQIRVTNRIDRLEMSVMAREFALQFALAEQPGVTAEIRLKASLKDLADEILEAPDTSPGCALLVRFYLDVTDVPAQCKQIRAVLQEIWEPELPPIQTLSFEYGEEPPVYRNTAEVNFSRKINEDQMDDIPDLIEHVLRTLAELNAIEG